MTIIGNVFACAIAVVTNVVSDTFSLSRYVPGTGYGFLMPYRASFPLYSLVGLYRSPGAVTRTFDCTHLTYAFNEDGITTASFGGGHGTANLGTTAGLWSLYSAATNITHTFTAGIANTETWGLTIAGVLTNYTLTVMGLTQTSLSTTFAGPHNVSTQRPWSTSGPLCASRSPLVLPQAHADYTTPPNGEFAAWLTSSDTDGVGSASGTLRADSAGSTSYAMFGGGIGVQFRFNCGGVYDVVANNFDPTVHPMAVATLLSLLPA